MPQSVGDVTAHRRLLLGVWAGPWIGLQLNRKDLAGYAGRGPSLASPCADVDRLSDRRFVVMGRQEPGRLGEVLSARRHEPGGAPALLGLSVPLGGGRLELLRDAAACHDAAMGRTHP